MIRWLRNINITLIGAAAHISCSRLACDGSLGWYTRRVPAAMRESNQVFGLVQQAHIASSVIGTRTSTPDEKEFIHIN